jgi:hypothetical protein
VFVHDGITRACTDASHHEFNLSARTAPAWRTNMVETSLDDLYDSCVSSAATLLVIVGGMISAIALISIAHVLLH